VKEVEMTAPRKQRIVILGGGFGGAYAAQELERRLRPEEAEIVLINRSNYFIFYPLLIEAGTGSLHPRHAVVSLRSFLKRHTTFRMADVTNVDRTNRRLEYRLTGSDRLESMTYDHLVIALGSVTKLPPVEGLAEHGFDIKGLTDAVALRDRAIQMMELADAIDDPEIRRELLHFVVVGANFTGIELAGEFNVFLRAASKEYRNVTADDCRMTVVELGDRILPALEEELAEFAAESLRRRGVDIRLGCSVSKVTADEAVLTTGDRLASRTVIWCAGISPSPLITSIGVPVDERGYIVCERDLRVQGSDSEWAIGDCAVNPDRFGEPYPATAQHAIQQAKVLGKNLVRRLRGHETVPCDISSKGALAALGCRTGVAKVFGVKLAGFPAWFLWRTVYLMKMPGLGRRVRVAIDWTLDLVSRADYVQLGIHRVGVERSQSDVATQPKVA
jgi:NADH dehydrogenase